MTSSSSAPPLSLAIVGHTNTGKTSLIRTLLRSGQFGCVKNAAGTTRHVESATLMAEQTPIIEMFDTPGLEDSIALLETLQSFSSQTCTNGRQRLEWLLQHCEDYMDFDQEIKVIRQAINSDVLLYIIDIREPILDKYLDEITTLSMAARPIIPVFNFTTIGSQNLERWRNAMAEFNLHSVVEFDTVAFDFEAEKRLYQKLQSVIEPHYEQLQQLIDFRQQHWQALQHAATLQVAELLINITCYRRSVSKHDDTDVVVDEIQNKIRDAEHQCLQNILTIFEFSSEDLEHHTLAVTNGRWSADLFATDTLKEFGFNTSSAAAKGALVGAGVDLMVAGLSLGTASMIGALLGAGWSTIKRYGNDLVSGLKGVKWLCVDEQTLSLVLLREQHLLHTLLRRGHAAQHKIPLKHNNADSIPSDWPQQLKTLRHHEKWSSFHHRYTPDDKARKEFLKNLQHWILTSIK